MYANIIKSTGEVGGDEWVVYSSTDSNSLFPALLITTSYDVIIAWWQTVTTNVMAKTYS